MNIRLSKPKVPVTSPRVHTLSLLLSQAYWVETEGGVILVDAGSPGEHRAILRQIKGDLALIFLTHAHFDHVGSAKAIGTATGAPIAIHGADAADLVEGVTRLGAVRGRGHIGRVLLPLAETILRPQPTRPDLLLDDGDTLSALGLDATLIHTPGHTPGSSTLLLAGELAFVGDLLTTTGAAHAQGMYASDWSQIQPSIRRVADRNPRLVYCGHGKKPASGHDLTQLLSTQPTDPVM